MLWPGRHLTGEQCFDGVAIPRGIGTVDVRENLHDTGVRVVRDVPLEALEDVLAAVSDGDLFAVGVTAVTLDTITETV